MCAIWKGRQTNRPSYRDASMHLNSSFNCIDMNGQELLDGQKTELVMTRMAINYYFYLLVVTALLADFLLT